MTDTAEGLSMEEPLIIVLLVITPPQSGGLDGCEQP
jgi:hypothetical protein